MKRPFAITLDPGSSLANLTGTWRSKRPVFRDHLPPCNHACPAGENIQAWLYHAEEGNYHQAWQEIMKANPLPAVMGRACYHTCEDACNRAQLDETVGIHAVERFLGDLANVQGWTVEVPREKSGKKILVVGSGPAGLACAYHLTLLGHEAVIHEAASKSGGLMRYGMPRYRLPEKALDAEIARIEAMGVTIHLATPVKDLLQAKEEGGFDAVFVGIGAQLPRLVEIPGDGSVDVVDAITMLRRREEGNDIELGKRTVVYGGGNVAMDAARSALRLGAKPTVVYRRTEERMPAHRFEIKEAKEEGVVFNCLRTIKEIKEGGVVLETMVLTDHGGLQPTGRLERIEAESVILALGQQVDMECCLTHLDGVELTKENVLVDQHMMTGLDGFFAGGDVAPSERTMTIAVGHGKKAARSIDAWFKGETYASPPKNAPATYDALNTWYYRDAPKTVQPILEPIRRQTGFAEVLGNLEEDNALFEARRCLSCGNCFECDNCYGACPDNAITKLGPGKRFEFKYDYCKGCGMCVEECPCGAIDIEDEEI